MTGDFFLLETVQTRNENNIFTAPNKTKTESNCQPRNFAWWKCLSEQRWTFSSPELHYKKKKIKFLQVDETWSYQKEIKSTGNNTLQVNIKTFCLMT